MIFTNIFSSFSFFTLYLSLKNFSIYKEFVAITTTDIVFEVGQTVLQNKAVSGPLFLRLYAITDFLTSAMKRGNCKIVTLFVYLLKINFIKLTMIV